MFTNNPSNSSRDLYLMLFELTIEKGACFSVLFFSAIIVTKDSTCTISYSMGQASNNQRE